MFPVTNLKPPSSSWVWHHQESSLQCLRLTLRLFAKRHSKMRLSSRKRWMGEIIKKECKTGNELAQQYSVLGLVRLNTGSKEQGEKWEGRWDITGSYCVTVESTTFGTHWISVQINPTITLYYEQSNLDWESPLWALILTSEDGPDYMSPWGVWEVNFERLGQCYQGSWCTLTVMKQVTPAATAAQARLPSLTVLN